VELFGLEDGGWVVMDLDVSDVRYICILKLSLKRLFRIPEITILQSHNTPYLLVSP